MSLHIPAYITALQFEEDRNKENKNFSDALIMGAEIQDVDISEDVLDELNEPSSAKVEGRFKTVKSRNLMALNALEENLENEQAIAHFIEVKAQTEAAMDDLLK
jgi:hypothetical protein